MEIIVTHQSDQSNLSTDFSSSFWQSSELLHIVSNWRGEAVPVEIATTARLIWTDSHLCIGYDCHFTELDFDDSGEKGFDPGQERFGLWERDVCEAFIYTPRESSIQSYLEFEIAPNGQWCDLKVNRTENLRDWEWQSGMQVLCEISELENRFAVIMTIPFTSFGIIPQAGDSWWGNLFRITRLNGERQYLTLSPTMTTKPDFHVPESFVKLLFTD